MEQKPCPGLKYSMCRRGFCQCQDGFYEKDSLCKAELGEFVEEEEFCGTNNTFNKIDRCVCQNNQFYLPNMRSCIKGETDHKKHKTSIVNRLFSQLLTESTSRARSQVNVLLMVLPFVRAYSRDNVGASNTLVTMQSPSYVK